MLDKLASCTTNAWARPHGRYDFGSYAILAEELVGWDTLDQYDEVVLANDSCYLLTPLAQVFDTMDAQACDWWGLQATKRDYETARGNLDPTPLEPAKVEMIGESTWHQLMHLHVSSYFMVLRRPAFKESTVRRLLASVVPQRVKSQVILKYEIGFSRLLLAAGHDVATFIDDLYPYHPLYSTDYFALLRRGFPLLKRNLLSENPRDAPDLAKWKERVLEQVPDAPVEMLERNLLRVAADDQLYRSFSVVTQEDGSVSVPRPLPHPRMERLDERTPTYDHWWAFPVCAYDHTFAGNERAVFEVVRTDPSIKKIVLTRSRRVEVSGENVVVVPLTSPEGQQLVLRAGHIFVKHAPRINVPYPLSPDQHTFINLWHGIPLKRFGWATYPDNRESLAAHNASSRAVVTSSKIDTLAMTAAFYPLSIQNMWPTGLPRNDFILRAEELLPEDLRAAERELREELAGRRLLMFLPTFKDGQADSYYAFSEQEIAWLADCARGGAGKWSAVGLALVLEGALLGPDRWQGVHPTTHRLADSGMDGRLLSPVGVGDVHDDGCGQHEREQQHDHDGSHKGSFVGEDGQCTGAVTRTSASQTPDGAASRIGGFNPRIRQCLSRQDARRTTATVLLCHAAGVPGQPRSSGSTASRISAGIGLTPRPLPGPVVLST